MSGFDNYRNFGGGGRFRESPFYNSENVWNGIKESFRHGSDLTKIIYINIGVFICIKLLVVVCFLFGIQPLTESVILYLAVPSDTLNLLSKPWTIFTYMFVHEGFLHLLFNMLWLYWFGQLFMQFISKERLLAVYVLGGLSGAALYILAFNLFPVFDSTNSIAIGASASVMAIVFAVCFNNPNHKIYLFLVGPVKLIHIALFSIILDIISISSGNSGGHIAHLGGALYGYMYAINYRKGNDIASFFVTVLSNIKRWFVSKPKMKVKYKNTGARSMNDKQYNQNKKQDQDRINVILEKISKSGYDSLTKEEKEILFRSGRR